MILQTCAVSYSPRWHIGLRRLLPLCAVDFTELFSAFYSMLEYRICFPTKCASFTVACLVDNS